MFYQSAVWYLHNLFIYIVYKWKMHLHYFYTVLKIVCFSVQQSSIRFNAQQYLSPLDCHSDESFLIKRIKNVLRVTTQVVLLNNKIAYIKTTLVPITMSASVLYARFLVWEPQFLSKYLPFSLLDCDSVGFKISRWHYEICSREMTDKLRYIFFGEIHWYLKHIFCLFMLGWWI